MYVYVSINISVQVIDLCIVKNFRVFRWAKWKKKSLTTTESYKNFGLLGFFIIHTYANIHRTKHSIQVQVKNKL